MMEELTMTLKNVLNTISGGTKIRIFVNCKEIFNGCMAESNLKSIIDDYLDNEVYRINVIENTITLAC